jgi:exopolysaccharide production protein ExoQ
MTTQTISGSVAGSTPSLLPGLIGFFFSFRVFIILLTVRVFLADAQAGAAISIGLNLLLLVVVAFHSMGPAPRTTTSIWNVPCFRWVVVFLGVSLCSLLWTAAASLSAAAAYWCALAADVLVVVLLLRTGPEERVASTIMEGYVCGACFIALVAWMLPAQSDLRLGDEELLGPNQIGYVCAFAVFLAQYLIHRGAGVWKLPAAFLAITLLRSLSKTTIFAFIAGEAFLLIHDASISRKTKVALAAGACLVFAAFWNLLAAYYEIYTNAGNQVETLTGRLGIWTIILGLSLEQPWIGHGFHSVWHVVPPFGEFEARHAHNELLQQFYAYGVLGVCMLVTLYGSFYRQIRRLPRGPLKTLILGMLLFVLVRGLADTEAFDVSFPLWAITLFGVMLKQSENTWQSNRLRLPNTVSSRATSLPEVGYL